MYARIKSLYMLTTLCCFLLFFCQLLSEANGTEDSWTINLTGASKGLHIPFGNSSIEVRPAFEDYSDMMFQVCDAMKLSIKEGECLVYPLMTEKLSTGALATIADGNEVIIYDRRLSKEIGYAGAVGVIAHELGHHFCRHLHEAPSPTQELEADRFAGAAIRLAGYSMEDALAMTQILAERASVSHPGRAERQKAIEEGFRDPESAKTCR